MKSVLTIAFCLGLASSAQAGEKQKAGANPNKAAMAKAMKDAKFYTAEEMTWSPAPAVLPAGAQIAVLDGDPNKKGLYTFRLKFPAGYKVAPHWHPSLEDLTVISGNFYMGMGTTADESKVKAYGPGAFMSLPANHTHYVIGQEETIIQLHGMGPFGMTYINPADDPQKKMADH